MSDDKFEGIEWLGDAIGDALEIEVTSEKVDAEDFFQHKAILVVKVGSDERPASQKDIADVQECLSLAFKDWPKIPFTIVTHHAMDFSVVPVAELEKLLEKVKNEN